MDVKGMTIQIVIQTETGTDPIGNPIYSEVLEDVNNVLVGQPTTDDINTSFSLYGKRCDYVIGIPKGDEHDWTDAEVIIFGDRYRTIGYPMKGIDANIPLMWNQNVKVTRHG